jgi:hypothetical protein
MINNKYIKGSVGTEKRRTEFNEKCSLLNVVWNNFNIVTSLEECQFACENIVSMYDESTFESKVNYTIKNSNQVQAELWVAYLLIYNS